MTSAIDPLSVAGPKLDGWISEHVFGEKPRPAEVEYDELGEFTSYGEWAQAGQLLVDQNDGNPRLLAKYSTDMTAAWRVAERMRELGWSLALSLSIGGSYASFDKLHGGIRLPMQRAEPGEAPLAICRAAKESLAAESKFQSANDPKSQATKDQ